MKLSDSEEIRARRIEEALRAATEERANEYGGTWYALHETPEDQDDGFGSKNAHEAARMAVYYGGEEIALIYDNDLDETYATVDVSEIK